MSARERAYGVVDGLRRRGGHRLRFGGRYSFDDRRRDSETLVLILAGFKEYLWPYSLGRLAELVPPDADVCLLSAGVHPPELAKTAQRNNWSYLTTETRRISTVQNIAIREHPQADWIYKVDEDVLVTDKCFEHVRSGYLAVEDTGEFRPGFAAPILNVNGFSYVPFLEALGLRDEYASQFGGTPRACTGIPIHRQGPAAAWVWRHSVPVDAVARRFTEQPFSYSIIPHRFSTGFVLFRREFWVLMEGIRAPLTPPGAGIDEAYLCSQCVDRSRVMVLVHNAYAGHYAFGRQEATMRAMLDELRPGLGLAR
ncbi:MAG: hypothetical protein QOJ09_794 [Actinomycetota bacterium]|nr:hypothetical protein [Actinomycetota bacterium]